MIGYDNMCLQNSQKGFSTLMTDHVNILDQGKFNNYLIRLKAIF